MSQVTVDGSTSALEGAFTTQLGDFATCLGWSRDGRALAIGDASGTLTVLDAAGGKLFEERAHEGGVQALGWVDGGLVTGGADGVVRLRRPDGGAPLELPGSTSPARPWVDHVAVSPKGDRFATAAGRTARLWTSRGEPIFETEPHPSTVAAVSFGSTSDDVATCCYGGVHVWTVREAAQARHLAWKGSLVALAWSATGKIIACASQDNSVHFWRLPSGADSQMSGYPFKPKAIAFDAQGKLLATSGDAQVCCWDFTGRGPEGSTPIVLDAHRAQVTQLAFHPRRGLLASAAQDTGVIVWDPRRSKKPIRHGFTEDAASGLAWSPDGSHLAVIDGSGRAIVYRTGML